jgi:hypothetical protein
MTYTVNLAAFPFMALAAAVMLGAFGGTVFETGVAGLLVLTASEIVTLEFKGRDTWLKVLVMLGMPLGVALYVAGLVLMLGGLS